MKRIFALVVSIMLFTSVGVDAKVQFSFHNPRKDVAASEIASVKTDHSIASNSSYIPQKTASSPVVINVKEVFFSSPIIYTSLILLSMGACSLWLFALLSFRPKEILSKNVIDDLQNRLLHADLDETLKYCANKDTLLPQIICSALKSRHLGAQYMVETMKSEGKRSTAHIWQKISLLDDIVMVAPLIGLLGTIGGMFYAFYDINRSVESLTALFDGLGIAVGATVVGLLVAVLAMCFSSVLKYRTIKILNQVEIQAVALTNIIQNRSMR